MHLSDYRPVAHKIGVGNLSDIADNVYEYRTNLFKEASNMKESVLQMIYVYRRGGFSEAATIMLDSILESILNGVVLPFNKLEVDQNDSAASYKDSRDK